jgi:polyketide biosynthesis enoyl-CoA hydratase PksI
MRQFDVATLRREGESVAVVAMEEREHKNTFTLRLINGLKEAMAAVRSDSSFKVVVVHGFDNYFCCGGTKEELLDLSGGVNKEAGEGRVQFTDLNFHDLFLGCEIPVIAAMQGHALGAGLSLGCTADIVFMGEQCLYSAIFMKYGFTPGFGATYIIPKKLGETLGYEMLISADNYYGRQLKERGAPVRIVSKEHVVPEALAMARQLADKPRLSLTVLKEHMNRILRREFQQAVEDELQMHRITFDQPEIRQRIEQLFGR